MERKNKLSVVKQTDNSYLRVIERAIEHGLPVLLENILEEVDSFLGKGDSLNFDNEAMAML